MQSTLDMAPPSASEAQTGACDCLRPWPRPWRAWRPWRPWPWLPPPPRWLGASVGQLPSAPPSCIHAGRRARAIHHAPKAGQAAARLAEHNRHAGLAGISSRRREARLPQRGPLGRGPSAAERPGAERPALYGEVRPVRKGLAGTQAKETCQAARRAYFISPRLRMARRAQVRSARCAGRAPSTFSTSRSRTRCRAT